MAAPPQLTQDQAREALNTAVATFDKPENREKLADIVKECNAIEDPMAQQMAKMQKLLPEVTGMLSAELEKYGFTAETLMAGMMQVNMLSMGDDEMTKQCQRVMAFLSGKFDA